jgi:hypothetical protein
MTGDCVPDHHGGIAIMMVELELLTASPVTTKDANGRS